MQRSFLLSKKNEERFGVDEVTADALKQSGYSKEQIEAIQDQLKKFTEKGE